MAGSIVEASYAVRRAFTERPRPFTVRQALVACGIGYAVLYPVVNDVVAGVLERIGIGARLLWLAVVAVVLLRRNSQQAPAGLNR